MTEIDRPTERHTPHPGGIRTDVVAGVVGVFAKHWTPGQTKTRLAKAVGEESAAATSRLFVETTLRRLSRINAQQRIVACTPIDRIEAFRQLPSVIEADWHTTPQSTGDLGVRMAAFFADAAATNPAVLVGSDSPDMPLGAVDRALRILSDAASNCRLVLGPSEDGGYWLIGLRGEAPPVFADLPWSASALFNATIDRLKSIGWREGSEYELVDRWYDVDEATDLHRLRQSLDGGDADLAQLARELDALHGPLVDE